jgi:hypothetical protein
MNRIGSPVGWAALALLASLVAAGAARASGQVIARWITAPKLLEPPERVR